MINYDSYRPNLNRTLNADAYGVTDNTLFLYVILLPISYKIYAFLWRSGPISNRPTSFLRLRPLSRSWPIIVGWLKKIIGG